MNKSYERNNFFLIALIFFFAWASLSERVQALIQTNRILLVDDFDPQKPINRLGGGSQVGEEFPASCTVSFVTGEEAFGKRGSSLVLDYEVSTPGSFAYFLTRLGTLGANLTEMSYLSFWVKSEGGSGNRNMEFFVEFHEDTNGDKRFVWGSDAADRVSVSRFIGNPEKEKWRKVLVPLSSFRRIRHWDQILEMAFIFEGRRGGGKGKLLIDNLLLGSNYPEGIKRSEIPMQNRVSSFKIGGEVAHSEMKLKRKLTPLTLTLTFIDPYLEEIRFEESPNGGETWQQVQSFYDHSNGGVYSRDWDPRSHPRSPEGFLVRAVGVNVLGGETNLAGPYRLHFD